MVIPTQYLVLEQGASLSRLTTIKRIRRLEIAYKQHLTVYPADFREALRLYKRLNRDFRHLDRFVRGQQRHAANLPSGYPDVLVEYHDEIVRTHQAARQILLLYLGAWLDHDATFEIRREIRHKWYLRRLQQHAAAAFAAVYEQSGEIFQRHVLDLRLKYLDQKVSPKQRLDYLELYMERIRGLIKRTYRREHHRLRELFNTILYAHSSLKEIEKQVADFDAGQRGTLLRKIREFIRDILHGYTPRLRSGSPDGVGEEAGGMLGEVRSFEKIQQRRRLLSVTVVAVAAFLFVNAMYATGGNRVIMRHLKWAWHDVVQVFKMIPHANEKMAYFENEIINTDVNVSVPEFQKKLANFVDGGLYRRANKHEILADFILKDYLILLAKGQTDPQMQRDMYRAGFLVDPEMLNVLEALNGLYRKRHIMESDLREQMLELRRLLIRGNVYPHLFLVIRDATPYVFLYPDRIEKTMLLKKEDLQKLGMDPFWYDDISNQRLQAYFMSGENYPFKGKAGFFEGEFAIVFTSLSTRPYWTAWHELGHVVDYMQYTFAGQPVPPNVEVNAVLFPLIFSDHPKNYLQRHVFKLILHGDRRDSYVQSAKGILNGTITYLNEVKGFDQPLITNRFEKKRIDWIWMQLNGLNDEQLRQLGILMCRNQPKYLITAEPASYRTVFTNTEEIVYGVHGSPQKEVIDVTSGLAGLFATGDGPRFIRDGEGPADDSAALRRAALIRAVIVFFLFEALAVLIHFLASPYRNYKTRGRPPLKIIDRMFRTLPSDRGARRGQRHLHAAQELLHSIYDSAYDKGELFQRKIDLFRLTSSNRERFMFHAGLAVAPAIPDRSVIRNEFHLLLFYLPFLGPYLARHPWLFWKQRPFAEREKYNRKILKLVTQSPANTPTHKLSDQLDRIMKEYEQRDPAVVESVNRAAIDFEQIQDWVMAFLDKVLGHTRLNYGGRWMDMARLAKAMEQGSDFDRLDKYVPGDDIRMIDWNVTARSTTGEAMVRTRVHEEEVKVAFLFDMTTLDTVVNQKKWAADLAKSIRAVGGNNHLKTIVMLYPDGQYVVRPVSLHSKLHNKRLVSKVLTIVRRQWEKSSAGLNLARYSGLRFYSPEENQRYRKQLNWLSYDFMDQQTTLGHLKLRNHTIFMIGVKPQRKKLIAHVLNRKNKAIFW